uniref:Uridylate-specific endoribonuclease n=2 Tax=Callorhinchus milii TaxID=7868 RepID=A0A4W3J5X4_CALMI
WPKGQVVMDGNMELSEIAQKLWDSDVNRLQPGKDYRISLQGKAGQAPSSQDTENRAPLPLFNYVNEEIFKKETFSAFISLLDNYVADTGEPEVVTAQEEQENHRFLDALMETPVLQIAHSYLVKKGQAQASKEKFKQQLYDIWFRLYARRGSSQPDSSGFEHVFVGETRGGRTVIGFHNWIQLYFQEKLGNVDYKGYAFQNSQVPDENKHLITLQFSWKKGIKPRGSCFIGVSPEFEFALYTITFLKSSAERNKLTFSRYEVEIVCHSTNNRHIETTYPILLRYL